MKTKIIEKLKEIVWAWFESEESWTVDKVEKIESWVIFWRIE